FEFFNGNFTALFDDFFEWIRRGIKCASGCIDSYCCREKNTAANAFNAEVGKEAIFFLGNVDETNKIVLCDVFHLNLNVLESENDSSQKCLPSMKLKIKNLKIEESWDAILEEEYEKLYFVELA